MANIVIYKAGMDMFQIDADCYTIPVNKRGVMGAGLALYAKMAIPGLCESYSAFCKEGWDGFTYLYRYRASERSKAYLCFATKDDWRNDSRLEWIIEGCEEIVQHYKEWGIRSIVIPSLGCGRGQLLWEVVLPEIVRTLMVADDDLLIHICPPLE